MNTGALFYRQTRLTLLLLAIIVVGGMSSLLLIPQQEDPRIVARFATIVTVWPGASAERVEKLITERIEDSVRELGDISVVRSSSRAGISVVSIEVGDWVVNPSNVLSEARDKVDDAARLFPPGAGEPNFDDDRVYAYALVAGLKWTGDGPPNLTVLGRLAEELQDRLRAVPGTDLVTVFGAPAEEIRITLRPEAVSSLGLRLSDVSRAIAAADAKNSAGIARGEANELTLEVRGAFDTLDRIAEVPIRVAGDGAAVRLGEIAEIDRTVEDPVSREAYIDGVPGVAVATRTQEGVRLSEWEAAVQDRLADFETVLGGGIELDVLFNQSVYTQQRFAGLIANLVIGVALVVIVLFVTLGFRASLLVAIALPISGLIAMIALDRFDMPLHQMSITGLIVALGLVVDAAIVMVDSIQRRLSRGASALDAVSDAVGELWVPLLSSTATTVLGFMPLILLIGPIGEFIGGIGLSVIVAVTASFFAALTLIPALTGRWLGGSRKEAAPEPGLRFWQGGLRVAPLSRLLENAVRLALRFPASAMLAVFSIALAGFVGATTLTSQFFPAADRNQAQIELRLPEQASLAETRAAVAEVDAVIRAIDGVVRTDWFLGESAPKFYYNLPTDQDGSPYYAQAQVTFETLAQTRPGVAEIQRRLDLAAPETMPLVRLLEQGPPAFAPIEIRIFGPELQQLSEIGEQARLILSGIAGVTHTRATGSAIDLKLWVEADEDAAGRAGLGLVGIAEQLRAALDGQAGGTVLEGDKEIPVLVRAPDPVRGDLGRIVSLPLLPATLPADGGFPGLPVAALGDVSLEPDFGAIEHYQGERVNIVAGYTFPDTLPASVVAAFEERWAAAGIDLPPGYRLELGGEAEARSDAITDLAGSAGLIIVAMVAVIVLAFNSFRLAGIVFSVALMATGFGLLSLTMFNFPFGFQPIIGIIGAIGVAINGAIIVTTALKNDARALAGDIDAMTEKVMEGSRHIISTTLTTVAGFMPLILSDSLFWPPFATAIAGAVALASLTALIYTPAAFSLFYAGRAEKSAAEPQLAEI